MSVPATIPAMFLEVCDRYTGRTDKVAYGRKAHGQWTTITHDQLRHDVECFAMGLLHHGVVPGERVGIVSENRVEWAIADFAISAIGAVDVPIFPTLTPAQEAYIYRDCAATCVIVSNALQLSKIKKVWEEIPSLKLVIVMNDDVPTEERVLRFSDVVAEGEQLASAEERRQKFIAMASRVHADDLLTLIYTSGTTGNPKGVMLTHGNLMSNIAGSLEVIDITEKDTFLSYLPMCHSYERMTGYYFAFSVGSSTWIAESIETVAENMREVRPTVMTSVPRLFERIKMRVEANVAKEKPIRQTIFHWALGVGRRYVAGEHGPLLSLQYRVADKLVFSKIRDRTGGRLRFFASGGAPLSVEVGTFFSVIGLTILEGYGLTETSPVLTFNREGEQELGTVGRPIPNVQIRIAEDGEILAKGPNIMKGYWNDEAATRETVTVDGWLHTGDVGHFNERGHLVITDRKKHLLVSSGGKNIAPQPIEALLTASPLIDQALLIGDQREFCTALIVPEREACEAWAQRSGLVFGSWDALAHSQELYQALQRDITLAQKDLSKYERIRRFRVVATPFSVDNGLLTPTMKIKRKAVLQQYSDVVESMYVESM